MKCQSCHQPVEVGAAFCGNCGQPQPGSSQPNEMAYAFATPMQHISETKALLAVLLGSIGLVGTLFMPLVGLSLGMFGVVMGTMSRNSVKRRISTVGLILSSLAVLAGLATWAYAVRQEQVRSHAALTSANSPSIAMANLSTPCYSTNFVDRLNVVRSQGSCDMSAYNGQSLDASTDAYKIYANQSNITDVSSFTILAKQALEKDVKTSLPGFSFNSERVSGFAGSPSYTINVYDKNHNVAVVEAAVFHPVKTGDNVFVLVHAVNGNSADLQILEAQWQWK